MLIRPAVPLIVVVVFLSIASSGALAATVTWDAGGGDTNWSTAGNWSDDTAPTATDTVLFDGTGQTDSVVDPSFGGSVHQIQTTAAFTGSILLERNLTVGSDLSIAGGTLDMRSRGHTLTVKGSWTNDGATFHAGTGTVLLTGTGSHTLKEPSSFSTVSINDGLVGYWKFDEGSGTIAADSSGNGNDGTLQDIDIPDDWVTTNMAPIEFANNGALHFDAFNSPNRPHVAIGNIFDFDVERSFSIALWFRYGGTANNMIGTDMSTGWRLKLSSDRILFHMDGAVSDPQCKPEIGGLDDGEWHHTAGVLDAENDTLYAYVDYVDGDANTRCSVATGGVAHDLFDNFRIGGVSHSEGVPTSFFEGDLDDVRLYSRALSATEVARLAAGNQPQTAVGTYTLGAALDIGNELVLAAGTLDVSSSNYAITASGSWRNYGGVFNARSGITTLNGMDDILQGGGESFSTLAISSSSGATLGGPITVTSALTIAALSTLSLESHTLTATTASITNNGTIDEGTGKIKHPAILAVSNATVPASLTLTVTDGDENLNGAVKDTVSVTIQDETVTLTETTISSGIFTGTIPTAHGETTVGNGVVEDNQNCSYHVHLSFRDAEDSDDFGSVTGVVTDTTLTTCGGSSSSSGGGGGGGRGRRGPPGPPSAVGPLGAMADKPVTTGSGNNTEPGEQKAGEAENEPPAAAPAAPPPSGEDCPALPQFRDVPSCGWFAPFVEAVTRSGIAEGYKDAAGNPADMFGPGDPVTAAQFLKMALGAQAAVRGIPGTDETAGDDWAAPYLAEAQNRRLSLFTPSLDVHAPLPRGTVLQTLLQIFGVPIEPYDHPFTDLPASHPRRDAIATAFALGLISGDSAPDSSPAGTVRPDAPIARAEAAKILALLISGEVVLPSDGEQELQSADPASPRAAGIYRVTTPVLFLKTAPAAEAPTRKVLRRNELVRLKGDAAGPWLPVQRRDGLQGFAAAALLSYVAEDWPPAETVRVTSPAARLRGGAFIDAAVRGTLPQGTVLTVLRRVDVWVHVRTQDGREGYVASWLVGE